MDSNLYCGAIFRSDDSYILSYTTISLVSLLAFEIGIIFCNTNIILLSGRQAVEEIISKQDHIGWELWNDSKRIETVVDDSEYELPSNTYTAENTIIKGYLGSKSMNSTLTKGYSQNSRVGTTFDSVPNFFEQSAFASSTYSSSALSLEDGTTSKNSRDIDINIITECETKISTIESRNTLSIVHRPPKPPPAERQIGKTITTTCVLLSFFFILNWSFWEINVIFNLSMNMGWEKIDGLAHLFLVFNSAVNPIIYLMLDKRWRRGFWRCFWRMFGREV